MPFGDTPWDWHTAVTPLIRTPLDPQSTPINTVTVEREGICVEISENAAQAEDIARACRDAMLGLSFSPMTVNGLFGEIG